MWPPSLLSRLVLLPLPLITACAGLITTTERLDDPVEVYLLEHSPHTTLVLPTDDGGLVRFKYCDWRWCVEEKRSFPSGAAALLWPTPSGIGRGQRDDVTAPQELGNLAPDGIARYHKIMAEREKVRSLINQLNLAFEDHEGDFFRNESTGLDFVPYSRGYWLAHQSNLVVAKWLTELGFEVRSYPLLTRWQIESPSE